MAVPTKTRTELRRSLCKELAMPFFRRFPTGSTVTGLSITSDIIIDTALTQPADFWNNQWLYHPLTGEARLIKDFQAGGILSLERAIDAVDGDTYEILSLWSPYDIHSAIDRAIEEGYPAFFEQITSEELVYQEDKVEYDLTDLATAPWTVQKVWLEPPSSSVWRTTITNVTGTAGAYYIEFADPIPAALLDQFEFQLSVLEDSTEEGKLYALNTPNEVLNTMFTSSTNQPNDGSVVQVWCPALDQQQWYRLFAVGFDTKEFPDKMYIKASYPSMDGYRLRIEYIAKGTSLTAETSTTCVPAEYISRKAKSFLFGMYHNDNRADRQRFAQLEEQQRQLAEDYRAKRAFRRPEGTLWQSSDPSFGSFTPTDNPLGWR